MSQSNELQAPDWVCLNQMVFGCQKLIPPHGEPLSGIATYLSLTEGRQCTSRAFPVNFTVWRWEPLRVPCAVSAAEGKIRKKAFR